MTLPVASHLRLGLLFRLLEGHCHLQSLAEEGISEADFWESFHPQNAQVQPTRSASWRVFLRLGTQVTPLRPPRKRQPTSVPWVIGSPGGRRLCPDPGHSTTWRQRLGLGQDRRLQQGGDSPGLGPGAPVAFSSRIDGDASAGSQVMDASAS